MGNACEICQEERGNYTYDPYQRQFTNNPPLFPRQPFSSTGAGSMVTDAPHPSLVKAGITLPTLNPLVASIIERQNTLRPFSKENVTGVRLQPF